MDYPVFVKGDVEFQLDDYSLQFKNRNLSVFGVSSLPWPPLSPERHFGCSVVARIRVMTPEGFEFKSNAYIVREQTATSQQMGLKFIMDEKNRDKFTEIIRAQGFYPTEYMRKYPRIPSSSRIQTFPLRIIGAHVKPLMDSEQTPIIFEVYNISLGGVLIATENPLALTIEPNTRINIFLEPRGDFSIPITVEGMVCRASDDINLENGNLIRSFGIRFTKVSSENRVIFLELLKDILNRIKTEMET